MEDKKIKLLLADDDRQQLLQSISYLNQFAKDFTLLTAPNGKVACKIADIEIPDVIVLDWTMPEMTGLEALQVIKSNSKTSHIPIIMATALTQNEDFELAFQSGAFDYMKKPYSSIELIIRVRNAYKITNEFTALREEIRKLKSQ